MNLGIDGGRGTAVLTPAVGLDFFAHHLVALAGQYILHSLGSHHLAGGGDQGRIAQFGTDLGGLGQGLVQLIDGVHHFELGDQIGQHAAGDLVIQALGIGGHGDGVESPVGQEVGPDALEEVGHLDEDLVVQVHLVAKLAQGVSQSLGGRLGGAAGEGGDGGVDHIGTRLHRLQIGHESQAGGAVGVDHHRQFGDRVLDGGDQVIGVLGPHDARHVFDGDGLYAHFLEILHHGYVLFQGVDRAGGEADGTGGVGPLLDGLVDGYLQVAHIVQSVEDTDDVDAVLDGVLHEFTHHVIGIVLIAQDVLASQQHLELGIGHLGPDLPQPLPGVLLEITQAHVKGSAAPHLSGVVASLVHGLQNGLEFVIGEAGGDQRLVRVTQHCLCKVDLSHVHLTSVMLFQSWIL